MTAADAGPSVDPHGFRLRGLQPTRLEGFSDAVFALAVTLLIVTFDVRSFAELRAATHGFVGFGATFAILVWIWYEHYVFFRRFGLRDRTTIALNSLLLFLVLLYVYPLKVMFSFLAALFFGLGPVERLGLGEARDLLILYGAGFLGVFLAFALLHVHALRRGIGLGLTARERHATISQIGGALGNVGIALISILIALTGPSSWLPVAGFLYFGIGIYQGIWHFARGLGAARIETTGRS
jgi:uncharacterized membrane protein